MECEALIHL